VSSSPASSQLEPLTYAPNPSFVHAKPKTLVQLGNFLGALQNWVKLQKNADADDELVFSIVGWHSLTLPQDPKQLSVARRDMLAVLLAIGLDPKRSTIFHQDEAR
jgi:tryptophanyl-tRNA synthetase